MFQYIVSWIAPDGFSVDTVVTVRVEMTAAEVLAEVERRGWCRNGTSLTVWMDPDPEGSEDWIEVR